MSAKDLWRIDEGQIIVPADRIRTHTQTEHIYDFYYIWFSQFDKARKYLNRIYRKGFFMYHNI